MLKMFSKPSDSSDLCLKIQKQGLHFKSKSKVKTTTWFKVNKRTQELIQSDSHQVPNTKGKDRQTQQNSHKMNRRQAELATLSQKRLMVKENH